MAASAGLQRTAVRRSDMETLPDRIPAHGRERHRTRPKPRAGSDRPDLVSDRRRKDGGISWTDRIYHILSAARPPDRVGRDRRHDALYIAPPRSTAVHTCGDPDLCLRIHSKRCSAAAPPLPLLSAGERIYHHRTLDRQRTHPQQEQRCHRSSRKAKRRK